MENRRVLIRDQSGLRDQVKEIAKVVPMIISKDRQGDLSDPKNNPMLAEFMRKNRIIGAANAGLFLRSTFPHLYCFPFLCFVSEKE